MGSAPELRGSPLARSRVRIVSYDALDCDLSNDASFLQTRVDTWSKAGGAIAVGGCCAALVGGPPISPALISNKARRLQPRNMPCHSRFTSVRTKSLSIR